MLAHFDETGDAQAAGALTFGLTPAQAEAMWEMLTGSEFCTFFEQLPGPTRLRDLAGHFAAQGLPGFRLPVPVTSPVSFLGVVLRRGGEPIGAIYLGVKKSGPEFTEEDEETLLMFAAQAALVIANARKHQDEQRARADLETLIDTSPVGVVVLDGGTGDAGVLQPGSKTDHHRAGRDRRRHPRTSDENAGETLRPPGRRAGVCLSGELPWPRHCRSGETVRARR